jgi:hypothetical protein
MNLRGRKLLDAGKDYIIKSFITRTFCQYYCSDEIKEDKMEVVGHVAHMEKMRTMYKSLVGIPEGKRPLRNRRHR